MPDREFKNPKELQDFAKEKFEAYFNKEVITGKTSKFPIGSGTYSPEPDVAVGPLAIGDEQYGNVYDDMARSSVDFIEKCIEAYMENLRKHNFDLGEIPRFNFFCDGAINRNARCFIAVEIENSPSGLKHVLGSTINAVALGRMGLLVGFSEEIVIKFLKCLKYLNFLKSVKKPGIEFKNGLVLSKEQFIDILENI